MKTNEVYTSTLMDLREVDSTSFTINNAKVLEKLEANPKLPLSSLLKQAKKEILFWTYGYLPEFYPYLKKLSDNQIDWMKKYPYMIMLVVQSMELGRIEEARYKEWRTYMNLLTAHVSDTFTKEYFEKYAECRLTDIERLALEETFKTRTKFIRELKFTADRIEKLKTEYPSASKLLDPIIKFYREWDVFSHVDNELQKIVVATRKNDELEPEEEPGDQSVSTIEQIGKTLYGEVWVAQLSRKLKNEQGKPLPQSSLKSMRDRNNFPLYIQKQLSAIYEQRMAEMKSLSSMIYTDSQKEQT